MFPVLLQAGPLTIYSYGVLIAFGGLLCGLFWNRHRASMGFRKDEDFWLFINVLLLGGFAGGRLLYLLEQAPMPWTEVLSAAFSLNYGFSVLGAFFGVTLSLWLLSCWLTVEFFRLLDYVAMAAPVWHFFGRLGCLAAGCCFGLPTDLPWAVTFKHPLSLTAPHMLGLPLHPAQLYEAAGQLCIAGALYRFAFIPLKNGVLRPGVLSAYYFIAYGVLRISIEFVRGDAMPFVFGATVGQALSGLLIGFGLMILCTRS